MKIKSLDTKKVWDAVSEEYGMNKTTFGKKINFVSDPFKRKIIFRDVEHAYILANNGYSKSATILAGSVIEELLRIYWEIKDIKPKKKTFESYIDTCHDNGLLKEAVKNLTHSFRYFRNLVHLKVEKTANDTIHKDTAKGAVSSIFMIVRYFK